MTIMADQYRTSAEECRRKADDARSAKDKAAWLNLAHSWLLLLKLEELPITLQSGQASGWPALAEGDSQERH